MKNKFKYIVITFVTIVCGSITSCDSFLDEDAKGKLTPDSYFKNAEQVTLALNKLNDNVTDAGFLNHLGTDIGVSGRSTLAASHFIGAYVYDGNTNQVGNQWSTFYTAVRDANFFLASIEKADVSAQVKGNALAQIKYFRADSYLNLVIQYGDIPYYRDEIVDVIAVSQLGKTDSKIIVADMAKDLDEAISSGFLSTARWNQNDGRPTVWAARMLKAYCHIWLAQYDAAEWAKARTELIEVTTKSPHGTVLGDYADMYRGGKEYHNDIIFGKQFLVDIKPGTINGVARPNTAAETNSFVRTIYANLGITNGSTPFSLRKSFANSYAATDARKRYNVWESEKITTGTTAGTVYQFSYVYIPKFLRAPVPTSDPLLATAEANNNSSSPLRIFVLADAYLLLSEAEFMINGSSSAALAAINKVRVRANLAPLTTMTLKDIQNERAWELCGEGYWGRKKDLIRWGILESTVKAMPEAERLALKAGGMTDANILKNQLYLRALDEANIINAAPVGKFRIFPIPYDEVIKSKDVGGTLTQNPLWE